MISSAHYNEDTDPMLAMDLKPENFNSHILTALLQIRATLGAHTLMLLDLMAEDEEERKELFDHFEKIREDLMLRYCFELQERDKEFSRRFARKPPGEGPAPA